MNDFWNRLTEERNKQDLYNYRNRLCSVKQFVGEGNIYIDEKTKIFSSKSVEVVVEKKNGEKYKLYCDQFVSNGIKIAEIDVNFLLYEELSFENNKPFYRNYCCIFFENERFIIKFDSKGFDVGGLWDYWPIEEPDDERFFNKKFKLLCKVKDYIGTQGSFYHSKNDLREFVITRFLNDPSPVRLLTSQELEFQLSNGKNPKDLLDYYISIYVNENGEHLRIFDTRGIKSQSWHRDTAILFIISQVVKNPYKYSFVNIKFDLKNYTIISS
jgi:hypothetical protein